MYKIMHNKDWPVGYLRDSKRPLNMVVSSECTDYAFLGHIAAMLWERGGKFRKMDLQKTVQGDMTNQSRR